MLPTALYGVRRWNMKVLHPTISWPRKRPDRIPKSLKLRWCGDKGYSGSRVDRLWKETLHKVQGAAKAQETRGMIGGRCILKKEIAWVRQCMHMLYFIFVFWHHILHKSGCFLGSVVTHHHMTSPITTRLNRSTTSCEWYGQRRKTRRRNILGSRVTRGHIWTWEVAGFCRWFMIVFGISFMNRMLCQCLGLLCTNWLAVLSISTGFLLECWCYPESLPPKGEMRLMYFIDLYVSFFELNRKKSPWYHQPRYAMIRDNSNIWL